MSKLYGAEQGSALIETTVLMVVLIPLIFGAVMIGKLIDLKQTGEQAGRYAAWEATVYPQSGPNGLRPAAVRERFFGAADNTLVSSAVSAAGSNRLWGEANGKQDRSWEGRTDVVIDESSVTGLANEGSVGQPTAAMRVARAAVDSGKILDGLSGNSWGLSANGLVRAGVGFQVKANEWLPANGQACSTSGDTVCLESSSVILVDGWSASDEDQARRRVRSLVPASALQPLGKVVSKVGHIPMFKELKKLDGAFGHVNMSALPEYAQ